MQTFSFILSSALLASHFIALTRSVAIGSMMAANGTFLYFAYGSNLLDQRIHINNPSAVRKTPAKLEGYRLEFIGFSRRWGGAVATITPDDSTEMWGAVWELDNSHKASLDTQEGVHHGVYSALTVNVTTEEGDTLECRTYRHNLRAPLLSGVSYNALPDSNRPSPLYRETILRGAEQSGLPQSYRDLLASIPSNSYQAGVSLDQFLAETALVNKSD